MKVAITGGTGLVGRNVAEYVAGRGNEVVVVARGRNRHWARHKELLEDVPSSEARSLKDGRLEAGAPWERFVRTGLDDVVALERAFEGCEVVVHCAGINRELGEQTYARVHVEGTRNVVEAAKRAGVRKTVFISFLRARPNCGSAYHESKWAAEEIVRASGLDYTILKCGVIYGRGDHMLDHLSHAFYTFPIFALVGFRDRAIRPNAVEDVVRIVGATTLDGALSKRTVAVVGPEEMTLREAVGRVAKVVGRRPFMFRAPVWFHYVLGLVLERVMKVPLVSVAQVRILSEGLAEAVGGCDAMPAELSSKIPFSEEQIRSGLPAPGGFGWRDLRWCREREAEGGGGHVRRVFFEMP
jgi:NADH dehydrogenase